MAAWGMCFDLPAAADGQGTVRQILEIPANIYSKVADQPLRLEMDYYATLLWSTTVPPLAVLNGAQQVAGFGWCASRTDSKKHRSGSRVPPGRGAAVLYLDDVAAADGVRRNPEKFVCDSNYEPVPLRFSVDPIDHVEAELPFRDPAGLAHFPVDATHLRGAQVIIRVYEPEDHFSRQVVVPQFRLSEWRAAAGFRRRSSRPGFVQLSASVHPREPGLPKCGPGTLDSGFYMCHSIHVTPAQ